MTNKLQNTKAQKRRRLILSLILKLCAFILFLCLFLFLLRALPPSITYDYSASAPAVPQVTGGEDALPTLRLYGDTLTLYSPGGEALRQVSLDASRLGEYDRQLLGNGIFATLEELTRLLEELIS